jgi:hypothetical protein
MPGNHPVLVLVGITRTLQGLVFVEMMSTLASFNPNCVHAGLREDGQVL